MGLRDMVPTMMLRLDLDQECYDFVKWWATCDPDGRYDWGNMTLPHLNIHGADVFEDPDAWGQGFALNESVAILLLKLKLLVDIRNIKITRKIIASRRLPFDLSAPIEAAVVRSPLSAKLRTQPPDSLAKTETMLLNQTRKLGASLTTANNNFMFFLFDPDKALCDNPYSYTPGSWEEMALAMQYSYAAWWETEGVLDLLNDARACAARDSEDEIEDMLEVDARRSCASHRTAEQMLSDVSVNRIWGYLDWAVKNASYLGPWSDRPSERHTREIKEAWEEAVAEEAEEAEEEDEEEDEHVGAGDEDEAVVSPKCYTFHA